MAAISKGSWELSGSNLIYKTDDGTVVATISGVKTDAAEKEDIVLDRVTGAITVFADALDGKDVTLRSSACTLTLDSGIKGVSIKEDTIKLDASKLKSSGQALVTADLTEGYTIAANAKGITYTAAKDNQTLATVAGLKKLDGATVSEADKIVLDDTSIVSLSGNKLSLADDLLNNAKITLTNANGGAYTLALASDTDNDGIIGFEKSAPYWAVSSGTATYKQDTEPGYTVASDGLSIGYTAKVTGAQIAKITGLNTKTVAYNLEVEGEDGSSETIANGAIGTAVTVDGGTTYTMGIDVDNTGTAYGFELYPNVLSTAKSTVAITPGTGYTGTLSLNVTVPQVKENTNIWTFNNGTGTYKNVDKVYYTLADNKVTCTPQTAGTTLATVSGLAKGDLTGSVDANDTTGVITLSNGALPNKDATATANSIVSVALPKGYSKEYTLALNAEDDNDIPLFSEGSPVVVAATKKVNKTIDGITTSVDETTGTATVQTVVTPGYIPAANGKSILYRTAGAWEDSKTKENPATETIATISGLKKGVDAETIQGAIEIVSLGESVMDEYGNITVKVSNDALTASNVTIVAKGSGLSYKLELDTGDTLDDSDTVVTSGGVDVWRINGTTATYKKVIPAYYSYDATKNTIVYHKETDVKTYAVVKGISSNLKVVDVLTYADSENETGDVTGITSKIVAKDAEIGDVVSASEWAELAADSNPELMTLNTKNSVITLSKDALSSTNVTFDTAKTGSTYTLALVAKDSEGNKINYAPEQTEDPKFTWTVSGKTTKTATLKGNMTQGWSLDSGSKSITYIKAGTATLATISGLDSKTTTKKVTGSEDPRKGLSDLGTGSGDSFENGVASYKDGDNNVITLNSNVLTKSNVSISGNYGFTVNFTNDDEVLDPTEAASGKKKVWSFDSTTGTATYYVEMPAYYEVDSTGAVIAYHEAENLKTLATLTGLNQNLEAGKGEDAGLLGVYDSEGSFTAYVTMDDDEDVNTTTGTVKLLSKNALNDKNVVLSGNSGYTLTVDGADEMTEGEEITEPEDKYTFELSGTTTAILKKGKSEGYELNSSTRTLVYYPEDKGAKIATVKGIKSSLVYYNSGDTYINENGETQTVSDAKPFFGVKKTGTREETVGENTRTITFDYIEPVIGLGFIGNEATNASQQSKVDSNEAIILTADALAKNDVTITNESGYRYQLSLSSGIKNYGAEDAELNDDPNAIDGENGAVLSPYGAYSTAWKANNGIASLVKYTPESWTETKSQANVNNTNNIKVKDAVFGIKYSAAVKGDTLATVTGLKSKTLTVDSDSGQIDGIDVEATYADPDDTTSALQSVEVQISNKHLNAADVTITPAKDDDVAYSLTLAEDVTAKFPKGTGVWTHSGNTWYYKEKVEGNGYAEEDGNIVYRKKGDITSTITNYTEEPVATAEDGNLVFTISLDKIAQNSKGVPQNVTLTTGNYNSNYKLALDSSDDENVSTHYVWKKTDKETKATYNKIESGFELAENQKSITYYNDKTTVLATINGLKKAGVAATEYEDEDGNIANDNSIEGIELTYDDDGAGTFTLDKSVLGQNNLTLTTKENYSLAIDPEYCAADTISPEVRKVKGTASIVEGTTEGWKLKDAKNITYEKEKLSTIVSISGLATSTESLSASAFDPSKKVITLSYEDLNGGGSKITLKDGTSKDYTLALQQTEDVLPTKYTAPKWIYKNGTATLQDGTSAGWELSNSKQISKVAAKLTNVATVKGLGKGVLYADDNGTLYQDYTPAEYDTDQDTGEQTLETPAIYKDPVLEFTPAEYDSKGALIKTGTITVTKSLLEDVGTDTLIAENKNAGIDKKTGVKSLTLGAKDNYKFVFDTSEEEAPDIPEEVEDSRTVVATGTGTIEYQVAMDDGWTLTDKAVTYTAATTDRKPKVLAKITGLSANITKNTVFDTNTYGVVTMTVGDDDDDIELFKFNEDNTITLYAGALDGITKNGTKVTLTSAGNDYTSMTLDDGVAKPIALTNPKWTVSGTTATLKEGTTAGWNMAANGKTMTFSAETADATLATVTGLAKGLKPNKEDGQIPGITVRNDMNTIEMSRSVLGASDVKINADSKYSFDKDMLTSIEPFYGDKLWTVKSGTATLKQDIQAGHTPSDDNKTLTYTKAETKTLVTLTGLNTAYNYNANQDAIVLDEDNNRIILSAEALGNKKVAIKEKKSGYMLDLADDVSKMKQNVDEWVTSGTTATYKNYDKAWYKISSDASAIEYNAESKPYHTYVTISGLAKGAEIKDSNVSDHVITLEKAQLGTSNLTLKDGEDKGYTLKLGDSVTRTTHDVAGSSDTAKSVNDAGDKTSGAHKYGWRASNGTATLFGTITEGYAIASTGKSITYTKDKYNQTFTKVTGLKTDLMANDIAEKVDDYGVITVDSDMLNDKNIALTNSNGSTYKLKLDTTSDKKVEASKVLDEGSGDEVFRSDSDTATWTTKSGTATLKGVVSAGYKQTSSTAITFTKATATKTTKINGENATVYTPQVLATVSGLATGASLEADANADADDTTIELKGNQLTSKVTVNGTGYYDFEFANDYNNSSIVGSASADSITVEGTGLTLNTAKGNDYVKFGNHGNTFLYANGDGDDVIADFTVGNDKLKVTSGTVTSVTTDGDDAVVTVGKGTITLKGKAGSSIIIYDKNNNVTTYKTGSADLMESDNFIAADSQLNELTGNYTNNALGDLNETQSLTGSDLTTLTKQSSLITYGSK